MPVLGGRRWIAGTVYLQNLMRSLRLLPPAERWQIVLLVGPRSIARSHTDLTADCDHVVRYAFPDGAAAWKHMVGTAVSLLCGRQPTSICHAAARAGASIVFPITVPLPVPSPVPWLGWIPDLQFRHLPALWPPRLWHQCDRRVRAMAATAPHLVVSSRSALADLQRWYPRSPGSTSVLPFVSAPDATWLRGRPQAVADAHRLPEKFLLFPSQFWVHKNHETLFEAIRLLRDGGLGDVCLVCTGNTGDLRRPDHYRRLTAWITAHRLEPHIRILGLLPRRNQIQILRRAAAVVQPSLFEGWSALVEDCRTLGKRLYASDIAVHREQQPERVRFFPPTDAERLAALVAADWPALAPGPDLAAEAAAYAALPSRALGFARSFAAISERAAGQTP